MLIMKKQWLFALGLSAIIAGCNNEKDYYQNPLDNLKPEGEYFDFATRDNVAVSLDLGTTGANSIYEIYLENPIEIKENGLYNKKSEVLPVYSNLTDLTGKSEVQVSLPAATQKVWVFNRNPFLPGCIELDITDNRTARYTIEEEQTTTVKAVRAIGDTGDDWYIHTDGIKYGKGTVVDGVKDKANGLQGINNLFVLCKWKNGVRLPNANIMYKPTGYAEQSLRSKKEINSFIKQANSFFPEGQDNSKYAGTPGTVNIKTNNSKGDYTNINLVVMGEDAGWHSPFGYFYYKVGEEPNANDLKTGRIPKYIILPDASDQVADTWKGAGYSLDGMVQQGQTIHLQFFGENYNQPASYDFPNGYVIGWFVIGDGTEHSSYNGHSWSFKNNEPTDGGKGFASSLDTRQNGKCVNFAVAANVERSMMYIGVEDDKNTPKPDFNDLMFYLEANPLVISPDIPVMSETEDWIPEYKSGTYAFEDQWPDGGDYDMNDVVTEYTHTVTTYLKSEFQDGKPSSQTTYVSEVSAEFTFVQPENAATFNNAFGIEFLNLDKSVIESATLNGNNVQPEAGNPNPSFIVTTNARAAIGQTYTLTLKLKANNKFDKDKLVYNPFIVENSDGSASNRKEVHLPKYSPTALGLNDESINQYYVDGMNGLYPFAIDLPIKNWTLVTEQVTIGNANEYPFFINWAESKGVNHKDWYLHKQ